MMMLSLNPGMSYFCRRKQCKLRPNLKKKKKKKHFVSEEM